MTIPTPNAYVNLRGGELPVEPEEFSLTPVPWSIEPVPGEVYKKIGDIVMQTPANQPPRLLVSLGKPEKIVADSFRRAGCEAAKWMLRHYAVRAAIDVRLFTTFAIP